jgi:hypothetical protein
VLLIIEAILLVSSVRVPQPKIRCRGEASLFRSPSRALQRSKSPADARPAGRTHRRTP